MRQALIWVGSTEAGILEELEKGFRFTYEKDYSGPRVFLGMPLEKVSFHWDSFPAFFDGLVPEGVLLEQLLRSRQLDRSDRMGLLLAIGEDIVGWVSACAPKNRNKHRTRTIANTPFKKVVVKPKLHLEVNNADIVRFHGKHKLRMSISGVQAKAQAVFERKAGRFSLVEKSGGFILKPQVEAYPHVPENEALSMQLATKAGIFTPNFGLVQSMDSKWVYYIQRFDRGGPRNSKTIRVEDLAQVMGVPTEWKYLGSIESLVAGLSEVVANPVLQKAEFFKRFLFNWIIGNGDMHLKNWSVIEQAGLIQLAPAYDYLNTSILLDDEHSALTLDDRKNNFDRPLLIDYLGKQICDLLPAVIEQTLNTFAAVPWDTLIGNSQLPDDLKKSYTEVVNQRMEILK